MTCGMLDALFGFCDDAMSLHVLACVCDDTMMGSVLVYYNTSTCATKALDQAGR